MNRLSIVLVSTVLCLAAPVASAQFAFHWIWGVNSNLAIPPSGTGGANPNNCFNLANVTQLPVINPIGGVIGDINISVTLTHSFVGDLRLSVEHCGVVVILFDRTPNSAANLGGTYVFDDQAATTFAAAVTASTTAVPAGTYSPANALAAFNGLDLAGTWTFRACDLASADSGILSNFTVDAYMGASYGGGFAPIAIQDGNYPNCVSPITTVLNLPAGGRIADLAVDVGIQHTYASDLDITLTHNSHTVFLSQLNNPSSSKDLLGDSYTFYDNAPTDWTAAEASPGLSIPLGQYRPLQPLSAFFGDTQEGPWYLTVCDRNNTDVGTLDLFRIYVTNSTFDFSLTQPSGSASVILKNVGGHAGNAFLNAFTLVPGSYPNGWLYGLDIGVPDLVNLVNTGIPFFGLLDNCGDFSLTIPGPIPAGITVYVSSIELDGSFSPVNAKYAFSYTTVP